MNPKVNSYNIFDEAEPSCILYHALAENEDQVKQLAEDEYIDISGLTIELERRDVRNQLGKPYYPMIWDAVVH